MHAINLVALYGHLQILGRNYYGSLTIKLIAMLWRPNRAIVHKVFTGRILKLFKALGIYVFACALVKVRAPIHMVHVIGYQIVSGAVIFKLSLDIIILHEGLQQGQGLVPVHNPFGVTVGALISNHTNCIHK